jgi:hypothetical protein
MIVGHNHHRLEKRITAALLSGIPYPREAYFLQQMSERILHKGKNTSLSDRQAERLFASLARCEKKPLPTPKRPLQAPRLPGPPQPEGPEPFRIEECFVDPQTLSRHSSTQPDHVVPPTPAPPAPAPEPVSTREPDIGSIIRRVIARNENFRKRRERIERQYLKSSSTSSSQYSPPEFLLK